MYKFSIFFLTSLSVLLINNQLNAESSFFETVKTESKRLEKHVIKIRRDFHQFPELSNREFKTSKKIFKILKDLGYKVQYGYSVPGYKEKVGVIATLKGGKPGKVVALRADIDALPIKEKNKLSFKSIETSTYNNLKTNVMHACGHDTHTAMLLGAAHIFAKLKDEIPGTIKLIFQPAEEGAPLNEKGGAEYLIEKNVLKNPHVDAIFGIHIAMNNPTGTVAFRKKALMAGANFFHITITGKPGHGSTPWNTKDPINASGYLITQLQSIISRQSNLSLGPAVLTVGKISGGSRNNIIPEKVTLEGTIRTFNASMLQKIKNDIKKIAIGIETSFDVSVEVFISKDFPNTVNDENLVDKMSPTLDKIFSKNNILKTLPVMGSEDFSFYGKKIPAFFFFLGARHKSLGKSNPIDGPLAGHHTPQFLLDEDSLIYGVQSYSLLALDYLNLANKKQTP